MKRIVLLILSVFSISGYSQNVNVIDLCMLNKMTDLTPVSNFLVTSKKFTYTGNFGKDEKGWTMHKFAKNENRMEIGFASGRLDDKLILVRYIVYNANEWEQFYKSLSLAKFEKGTDNKLDDGTPFEIWWGTTPEYQLTAVYIEKRVSYHEVTIN